MPPPQQYWNYANYVCMSRPMAVDIAFGVAIIVAWYKQ